jgi:hypothetical protein
MVVVQFSIKEIVEFSIREIVATGELEISAFITDDKTSTPKELETAKSLSSIVEGIIRIIKEESDKK